MVHVLGMKIVEDSPVIETTDSEASSSPKAGSVNGDAEGEQLNDRVARMKSPARRTPSYNNARVTKDSADGDTLNDSTDSPIDGDSTLSTRSQARRRSSRGVSK